MFAVTYLLYNHGSTLTIISAKGPPGTIIASLYVLEFRYAPGMSNYATAVSLYASTSATRNSASVQNIGHVTSYLLMYVHCLMPFAQAISFTLPSQLSFRKTKEAIALVCYSFVIVLGSTGKKFFISWSCESSPVADPPP